MRPKYLVNIWKGPATCWSWPSTYVTELWNYISIYLYIIYNEFTYVFCGTILIAIAVKTYQILFQSQNMSNQSANQPNLSHLVSQKTRRNAPAISAEQLSHSKSGWCSLSISDILEFEKTTLAIYSKDRLQSQNMIDFTQMRRSQTRWYATRMLLSTIHWKVDLNWFDWIWWYASNIQNYY